RRCRRERRRRRGAGACRTCRLPKRWRSASQPDSGRRDQAPGCDASCTGPAAAQPLFRAPMADDTRPANKPRLELLLEGGLFHARWLMAPFYVGLVVALGGLLFVFARKLFFALPTIGGMSAEEAILLVLSLI